MLKKTNITKDTADALLTKWVTENRPPSEQAKNKIWDEIKLVNPNADDITADFNVAQGASQAAAGASASATQAAGGPRYTVRSGDGLSKISQQFYGDGHEYMKIFYANMDKLSDPNKIQPGMELTIPLAEQKREFGFSGSGF